jgi:hypothetical protein
VRHGAPVHATALVLADRGVLIRGESGSGKTALALELFARARTAGLFAALVCDDQVPLSVLGDRLVGFAATPLAGLVEVRGLTPRPMPWVSAAVIDRSSRWWIGPPRRAFANPKRIRSAAARSMPWFFRCASGAQTPIRCSSGWDCGHLAHSPASIAIDRAEMSTSDEKCACVRRFGGEDGALARGGKV